MPSPRLGVCAVRFVSSDIARSLASYEFFYNYQRPHASLADKTPNEYLVALKAT